MARQMDVPSTPPYLCVLGYQLKSALSSGTSATILLASSKKHESGVACKWFRFTGDVQHRSKSVSVANCFRGEKPLMERFRVAPHPNLMFAYDVFESAAEAFIFMPYMPNGTVAQAIAKFKADPPNDLEDRAKIWFKDIVCGLHWLHLNEIVHRDLKLQNCLLGRMGRVVITDYGFAAFREDDQRADLNPFYVKTVCGSLGNMAPELLTLILQQYSMSQDSDDKPKCYSPKPVDVYAAGVCLFELLYLEPPFSPPSLDYAALSHDSDIVQAIATDLHQKQMNRQYRYDRESMLSFESMLLLHECLHPYPDQRFTTGQIRESTWLSKD